MPELTGAGGSDGGAGEPGGGAVHRVLVGGTGIGYYVWNEWNNLDLNSVIFSILMIGVVGMLLDMALGAVEKLVQYKE